MKLLVVDIGNTSSTLGLYTAGRVCNVTRVENGSPGKAAIARALKEALGRVNADGACVASVAPSHNVRWTAAIRAACGCKPLFISHRHDIGIPVTYPKPATIGADRLANAAGAVVKYGAPVIVGDFGTAVTFDVVTRKDGYIGGIIAPGPPLMFEYLAEKTELLPDVTWKQLNKRVGKSTREAMQLGAHWGYRGLFKEILAELKKAPALRQARVVATGGYAPRVLAGLTPKPIVDPRLTLFGLGCIYERNALA